MLRASTARTAADPRHGVRRAGVHLGADWWTSSRSRTRSRWPSPTGAPTRRTWSSAPTASGRSCGGGSPAPTTPCTPARAGSAASCRSRTCPPSGPGGAPVLDGPRRARAALRHRGDAEEINFFAVVEEPEEVEPAGRWPTSARRCVARFPGWHPAVTEMIRAAATVRWGLFAVRPCCAGTAAGWSSSATRRTRCCPTTGRARTRRSRTLSRSRPCSPRRSRAISNRCWRPTSGCGGRGPGRSRGARGRRTRCCTCATDPDLPWRDEKMRRFADDFGWIHEFDAEQALQRRRRDARSGPSTCARMRFSAGLAQVLGAVANVARGRRHADGPVRRGPRHRLAGTGRCDRRRRGPVRAGDPG